jgi:hypothetical protein
MHVKDAWVSSLQPAISTHGHLMLDNPLSQPLAIGKHQKQPAILQSTSYKEGR